MFREKYTKGAKLNLQKYQKDTLLNVQTTSRINKKFSSFSLTSLISTLLH